MVSVNGNGSDNLFVRKNVTPNVTPSDTTKVTKTDVPITDNKVVGEYGEKLLEQVQPRFVTAARIPETDAAELTEMYAMAGIKAPKMPTVAQYASISNHVADFTTGLDNLNTTNNVKELYGSAEFAILDQLFGIS